MILLPEIDTPMKTFEGFYSTIWWHCNKSGRTAQLIPQKNYLLDDRIDPWIERYSCERRARLFGIRKSWVGSFYIAVAADKRHLLPWTETFSFFHFVAKNIEKTERINTDLNAWKRLGVDVKAMRLRNLFNNVWSTTCVWYFRIRHGH